jgi:hypothetical protein
LGEGQRSDGAGEYWSIGLAEAEFVPSKLLAKAFGQRLVPSLLLRSKSPSLLCQAVIFARSYLRKFVLARHSPAAATAGPFASLRG